MTVIQKSDDLDLDRLLCSVIPEQPSTYTDGNEGRRLLCTGNESKLIQRMRATNECIPVGRMSSMIPQRTMGTVHKSISISAVPELNSYTKM